MRSSKTLNLVMIVKNEEVNLERCLKHLVGLTDGIVIVDTGSTDGTKKVAAEYGASVYDFGWNGDFSAARNFALSKSAADWNLVVDADEVLEEGDREGLNPFLEDGAILGAVLRRDSFKDGDGISFYTSRICRLLPRGVFYTGKIHEQADSGLPRVPVPLSFSHDGYMGEDKAERNLGMILLEIEGNPADPYYQYQAGLTLHHMKRYKDAAGYFREFYRLVPDDDNYRAPGIVLYLDTLSQLERYEDALIVIGQSEASLTDFADFQFFCGNFYMKMVLHDTRKYISYLPKIEECFKACLAIGERPGQENVEGTGSYKAAYNLGAWYEVAGDLSRAAVYYGQSAAQGFDKAAKRLEHLGKQ